MTRSSKIAPPPSISPNINRAKMKRTASEVNRNYQTLPNTAQLAYPPNTHSCKGTTYFPATSIAIESLDGDRTNSKSGRPSFFDGDLYNPKKLKTQMDNLDMGNQGYVFNFERRQISAKLQVIQNARNLNENDDDEVLLFSSDDELNDGNNY